MMLLVQQVLFTLGIRACYCAKNRGENTKIRDGRAPGIVHCSSHSSLTRTPEKTEPLVMLLVTPVLFLLCQETTNICCEKGLLQGLV